MLAALRYGMALAEGEEPGQVIAGRHVQQWLRAAD